MIVQIQKDISQDKISEIAHGIADAFYDYEYTDGEKGMKGFITTRESMYIFMRAVFEAAVKSGCAWSTEGGEGFLIMTDSEGHRITLLNVIKEMLAETEALGGLQKALEYSKVSSSDGGTISQEILKRNMRYVSVDILVVLKEHQHQGHMRELMEFVYKRAEEFGITVALETDDKVKADKYEHLGMILYRVRDCGPGYHVYDMIR